MIISYQSMCQKGRFSKIHWNSLRQHVIDSKDIDQFKQRLAELFN